MGMKEGQGLNTDQDQQNVGAQSQQLMKDLQNEFERSRAFQLSRGAGGKSGIGLIEKFGQRVSRKPSLPWTMLRYDMPFPIFL